MKAPPPTYEYRTDRGFRNVGYQNSDAGELPKRKHITYRTQRKLKIKNYINMFILFQNKHQQGDTYGLSFISRLVFLYSTCFELLGAHHQEFTFSTLYRQSLIYCIIFCCIPPVLLHVGNRTRRRTGGIQQKIIQYARDCLYSVGKVNS